MQLRHLKSIIQASDTLNRVLAIAWSPNCQKLAVCAADRIIQVFDETGERKDRFATKPADPKTATDYTVVALAFCPESSRLAVAQSDNVVFVYRLGLEWGEKKSICNKFVQTCEVTCLVWPRSQPNGVVFGLADGKVRLGNCKTNKSATLFEDDSYVISLASNPEGTAVVTGHVNGSINRFYFDDAAAGAVQGKFVHLKSPPYALAWGESVVAGCVDRTVTMYDPQTTRVVSHFDHSKKEEDSDFYVAEISPSGQSVVVGSFGRIHVYNYRGRKGTWEEAPVKAIENFYSVTAMAWKPDASKLTVGNLAGVVELFDCCLRRSRYKGKFEFTYVSPSQVIVKRLSTGARIVLKSHYGYEVTKIDIFQDQYLIAHTPETLLMGDLASCKLSEIPWIYSATEKYHFQNLQVCMVFSNGELSLVEYGVNDLLASCRTDHMNPHLISVRLNERNSATEVKRIAYLADLQTIQVQDIVTGTVVANIAHDSKIDWLELSSKGTKLLFRDKRKQLYLFDVHSLVRSTLLPYCSYVQWVPFSDVVVAQSRGNLCIWYYVDAPERVTTFPIKGDVGDIERGNGKTIVIVDEGVTTVEYTLDESLIQFGTALDDKDYERAVTLLESLEMTPETEAMWRSLFSYAVSDRRLTVAARCSAAVGNVARAHFLRQLSLPMTGDQPSMMTLVQAKLAVLEKDFKAAERMYVGQGHMDEAMQMYQEVHKWNLSIKVAEATSHPDLETLRRNYFQWLVDSGQEGQAGQEREEEGDSIGAINLYMKGGMPARAAHLLEKHSLWENVNMTEKVASALLKNGLFEKAGHLFQRLSRNDRALEAYKTGKAFQQAVDLCRKTFPHQVVALEEQWGDHLRAQKQMDAAVNHFIEAGKLSKAVEAAVAARQWRRAASILDSFIPEERPKHYLLELAKHFAEAREFELAERYFVDAQQVQAAVDMYMRAGAWEKAFTLTTSMESSRDVTSFYEKQARVMEADGRLKDAERLYTVIGEPDMAINMYKTHKQYDQMLRLVGVHHSELLLETHIFLAKTLEAEGNLKMAEQQYIDGKDWKAAANMYCTSGAFEDGYRVAKTHGGPGPAKQIAYLWARSLGGESAVVLLKKLGLLDAVIDFASDNGAFEFAFELSTFADSYRMSDVHYKHAMFLEDEGKFREAEQSFLRAGKPKEAILMYIHNEDWTAALAVAKAHDASSVPEILIGQAKVSFDKGEFSKGESLSLRAQKPEMALKFYKDQRMWKEAFLFAKKYVPSRAQELAAECDILDSEGPGVSHEDIITAAKTLEQQRHYSKAIDTYLKASSKNTRDLDLLEEVWERAMEISLKFVPQRAQEVASIVGTRLLEVKRYEQAGDLFVGIERLKDAIDAFVAGGLWDRARAIVAMAPIHTDYFDAAYAQANFKNGHADTVASVNATSATHMYAQSGQWEKCLELAQTQGATVLIQYLVRYCKELLKDHQYGAAIGACLRYEAPASDGQLVDIYVKCAKQILGEVGRSTSIGELSQLRQVLFKIVNGPYGATLSPIFNRYMSATHLLVLRDYCAKKPELSELVLKQSLALLRYTREISVDVVLSEAANAAKASNKLNVAFACWNRLLDITDAIDENMQRGLPISVPDDPEFQTPDVPNGCDLLVPNMNFLSEKRREDIRDWVLQFSLDDKVGKEMEKRSCDTCGVHTSVMSLTCQSCRMKCEECVVTGYPVVSSSRVECSVCNKPSNKEDWNKFVVCEKVCCFCGNSQAPTFQIK